MPIFLLLDIHLTANFRVQKCTTQGTIEIRFRILQRSSGYTTKKPDGWMIKGIKEACNKTTAIGGKRLSEVGRKTEKKQFD